VAGRSRVRQPTAPYRALPDFLVIGAQRAGTSSLYKYLGQHPSVVPSLRKEVGYFSRYYGRGVDWYRSHFPLRAWSSSRRRDGGLRSFEATPDYLLHPLAAARSSALLPDARFIVLLRDPVARAWSHHQHMVRLGFEDLSFADAIAAEDERIAADLEAIASDPGHDPKAFLRYSYVARGRYAEQLERWFAAYPRDRFLLVPSARLYRDTADVYDEIVAFLGLPQWRPASFPNHSARAGSTDEPVPEPLRDVLLERFAPDAAALRSMGIDLVP
jgi:hypothetical protein